MVKSTEELVRLIENMRINPRIRRSYASKYVYQWVTQPSVEKLLPEDLLFHKQFPNIGRIEQNQINEYVILILEFLKDNFHHLHTFQNFRPFAFKSICDDDNRNFCSVSEDYLFTTDTYKFDIEGKTLVVVTHRNSILELVDRIVVLDNGKIVADGPRESVLSALKKGQIGRVQ